MTTVPGSHINKGQFCKYFENPVSQLGCEQASLICSKNKVNQNEIYNMLKNNKVYNMLNKDDQLYFNSGFNSFISSDFCKKN